MTGFVRRSPSTLPRVIKPKKVAKALVPDGVVVARRRWLLRRIAARYRGASNADIFSDVYEQKQWGATSAGDPSSGKGSHDPQITTPYVDAVKKFLSSFATPPDVVDLGCGDFNVGKQLRTSCGKYTACDVVPALIERNIAAFKESDVDFRVVDIARDPLPEGEIVVIRQVLQHLSNSDIASVLPKLGAYRFAVITDHQPIGRFVPNADIPTGPHIRIAVGSALDLASPPFDLRSIDQTDLCVVPDGDTVVRTTVFRLS